MNASTKSRKVVITGAGDVGASFAYALVQAGLAEEIEFGVRDVCLSVPCIVSANGVDRIVEGKLAAAEMAALSASARVLRETLQSVDSELRTL